jgi:hypothetical protein
MNSMRTHLLVVCLALASPALHAQLQQPATTTLQAETGNNNLSASPAFTDNYIITKFSSTQPTVNGDVPAANVSKVPTRVLLYPGAQTTIFAEMQAWFCHVGGNTNADGFLDPSRAAHGCSPHIDNGVTSDTLGYMTNAVAEMRSRGIQGAIINWNGPGSISDTSAGFLRQASEATGGNFQFAIQIDKGAFGGCTTLATCTSKGSSLVQTVMTNYVSSPAYMKSADGHPMIYFFVDGGTSPTTSLVNFQTLKSSAPNALFGSDGQGGFSVAGMDGAYAWENVNAPFDPARTGVKFLGDYYTTATKAANVSRPSLGGVFKGFDDKLASWCCKNFPADQPRINFQRCGKTWLDSFAKTNAFYNSTRPLSGLQIVTWDDYEEGSEIETGIDNCVSEVSASIPAGTSTLQWQTKFGPDPDDPTLTGTEDTIDHYTVFINAQGGLVVLQDNIVPGLNQLDLTTQAIPPGSYTLYVKAVGKPSILNHMSGPVAYTVSGSSCLVNISSPANNATVTSPVQVTATATPSAQTATITSMEIDVDNAAAFTAQSVSSVNQAITINTSGPHTITVKATDSAGVSCASTVTINVSTTSTPVVTVSSPASGATVASPVIINASATSGSSTIASWHILVDNVEKFTGGAVTSISASVVMDPGTHAVVVEAVDAAGLLGSQTLSIIVPAPAGVTVTVTQPPDPTSSPVPISASASSAHIITGWHIYVDGIDSFSSGQVPLISASVPMTVGTHTVIVRAWDSTGANGDQTFAVNVTDPGVHVTVTAPANNAQVSSPVAITASATSARTITGWHIYVDNVDSFSAGQVASISASIAMTAGAHTVIVRAWDSSGANGDQTITANVVAEGVHVSVTTPPTATATVDSPASINANATSGHPITGWHIYVDGVDSFSAGQVTSISTTLPMDVGTHTVIVRAWDSTGAFGDQTLTLTVVSGVDVTVSSPVTNQTVASPFTVNASATSSHVITAWHIYADGVDKFSAGQVNSISASITGLAAGSHTLIIRAWDSTGATGDETVVVNVVTGVSVTVSSPANNAVVASPVSISASASSGHVVTGWHIYVDGVDSFTAGQAGSINASVAMSPGSHTVLVRAWDSTGAFGDQTLTLTVATGPTVSVTTPANNGSVTAQFTVSASASGPHVITGWHIYANGVDKFSAGQVSSINAGIGLTPGTYTLIVRAWDSSGASGDKTLTVIVR